MDDFGDIDMETMCSIFNGTNKCDIILGVRKATASLSLIGCMFMMIVIWLFRKYTLFTQRLILYLTIAAFFLSIAYLMQEDIPDGGLCKFQAFFVTWWLWSVLMWVSCITFNLLMSLARMVSTEKFEIAYHVIGWGIPLLVSSLPLFTDEYGPAGAWCWIKTDIVVYENGTRFNGHGHHWRFGIWYIPLMVMATLIFIANIYILITVKKKVGAFQGTYIYDTEAERASNLIKKEIRPLVAYPLIYIILYIPAYINRIHNFEHGPVFTLTLLQALISPLVGVVNAVIYGLDRETRKKLNIADIKSAFRRWRYPQSGGSIQEYDPPQGVVDTGISNPGMEVTTSDNTDIKEHEQEIISVEPNTGLETTSYEGTHTNNEGTVTSNGSAQTSIESTHLDNTCTIENNQEKVVANQQEDNMETSSAAIYVV